MNVLRKAQIYSHLARQPRQKTELISASLVKAGICGIGYIVVFLTFKNSNDSND